MKCDVCGCTDERACAGGCYWIADSLCSNCGVIIAKPYIKELINMLQTSGINSKQKVIDELQCLLEDESL